MLKNVYGRGIGDGAIGNGTGPGPEPGGVWYCAIGRHFLRPLELSNHFICSTTRSGNLILYFSRPTCNKSLDSSRHGGWTRSPPRRDWPMSMHWFAAQPAGEGEMTCRSRWSQGGFAQNAILAASLAIEAEHKGKRGPRSFRLGRMGS